MHYCDFHNMQEQTTVNIMGSILKQLVARVAMQEDVQNTFRRARVEFDGRGPQLPDVIRMAKQVIDTLPQVFICIDALDVCLPKHLLELLRSLKDILQESPMTRIFVTGRPQVEAEITRYFATRVIVPISPKRRDVSQYLEKKLELDSEPDAICETLRADILRIIPERMSEMCVGASRI